MSISVYNSPSPSKKPPIPLIYVNYPSFLKNNRKKHLEGIAKVYTFALAFRKYTG